MKADYIGGGGCKVRRLFIFCSMSITYEKKSKKSIEKEYISMEISRVISILLLNFYV
jgi:hypothetical protein